MVPAFLETLFPLFVARGASCKHGVFIEHRNK